MAGVFFDSQLSGVQWIKGIVHIGANVGQEVEFYSQIMNVSALFIEPLPDLFKRLETEIAKFPQSNFYSERICCSDVSGELTDFFISPEKHAQSSSLLKPSGIVELYPWMSDVEKTQVETIKLDDLLDHRYPDFPVNMLTIDTQGADLKVLKGAQRTLAKCDGVYVEVADQSLYEGGCTFKEIIDFMDTNGFGLYRAVVKPEGWGNAFFKRRLSPTSDEISEIVSGNVAVGKPTSESSTHRRSLRGRAAVDGQFSRTQGFRSGAGREDQWIEVDLEQDHKLKEIILVGPANKGRYSNIQLKVRQTNGEWKIVYDYSEKGKILTRFDRIQIGDTVNAIRVESKGGDLYLAQILAIEVNGV